MVNEMIFGHLHTDTFAKNQAALLRSALGVPFFCLMPRRLNDGRIAFLCTVIRYGDITCSFGVLRHSADSNLFYDVRAYKFSKDRDDSIISPSVNEYLQLRSDGQRAQI